METYRIVLGHVDIDGIPVEFDYGDVYVVLRDGADVPETTDWEVQLRTAQFHRLRPARHDLAMRPPDGTCLRGAAIVRFSDGHRHLLRGDASLEGFVAHRTTG